jgi:hypothetical protein
MTMRVAAGSKALALPEAGTFGFSQCKVTRLVELHFFLKKNFERIRNLEQLAQADECRLKLIFAVWCRFWQKTARIKLSLKKWKILNL